MRILINLIAGILFGLGLLVSGMANPAKVLNFLDLAGMWDPSLAFVMAGAIAVTLPGYRLVFRRSAPLLSDRFRLPTSTAIDYRLILGAAVFGIGWGRSGFCPGSCRRLPSAASQGNAGVRARGAAPTTTVSAPLATIKFSRAPGSSALNSSRCWGAIVSS